MFARFYNGVSTIALVGMLSGAIALPLVASAEPLFVEAVAGPDAGMNGLITENGLGLPPETADSLVAWRSTRGILTSTENNTASGRVLGVLRDITLFGGTEADARAGTFSIDTADRVAFVWSSIRNNFLDFTRPLFEDYTYTLSGIQRLSLVNVTATILPRLHFTGADQRLELRNADLAQLSLYPLSIASNPGGRFTIAAEAGSNRLYSFATDFGDIGLNILVRNGATLLFDQVGDLGQTERIRSFAQYPNADSYVLIDSGELSFHYGNVVLDRGHTEIRNGGVLSMTGSESRLILDNVLLADGEINLQSGDLEMHATNLTFGPGLSSATPTVTLYGGGELHVSGNTRVSADAHIIGGEASATTEFSSSVTIIDDGATFEIDGRHNVDLGFINFGLGSVLEIRNGTRLDNFEFIGPSYGSLHPAQFRIGNHATATQTTDVSGNQSVGVEIGPYGIYRVDENISLKIRDEGIHFTLLEHGTLSLGGVVEASGHIRGQGGVIVDAFARLSVADVLEYGSLHFETAASFDHYSRLDFDIGVDLGSVQNDVIFFGQNNLTFGSADFHLYNNSGATAEDFDNRRFTLVRPELLSASDNLSVAGTITITPDHTMPAGLTYRIVDDASVAGRDLTLETDVDTQAILHRTSGRNHRDLMASIVTTSTLTPDVALTNGTTLGTAVNTLTLGGLSQLSSAHLEGFASAQSVAVERQELLADVVLSKAQDTCAPGSRQWYHASAGRGTVEAQGDLGGYSYRMSQAVAGVDLSCDAQNVAGFYLGLGGSGLSTLGTVDHDVDSTTIGAGFYLGHQFEQGLDLTVMAGIGYGNEKSERVIPNAGAFTGGVARTDASTYSAQIAARLASDFDLPQSGLSVTPSVTLAYAVARRNAATETGGGDFNYSLNSETTRSIVIEPALAVQKTGKTSGGNSFWLSAEAAYSHDFSAAQNREHEISGNNALFGSVTQVGQNRGADGFGLGLAAGIEFSEQASLQGALKATRRSHGTDYAVGVSFAYKF